MRISTALFYQRATDSILAQQAKVSLTELQLATGKRILKPSDDPIATNRIMELNRSIENVKQYQSNANYASARLEQEEDILGSAVNFLQRTNDLAIQGNNATASASDRNTIANEVDSLLNGLLGLANTMDFNGEYIFGGYQRDSEPFTRPALNTFVYGGDQGQRTLQLSPTRQVADGDNGFDVFVDVETASFATTVGVAATSLASINDGDLTINGISVGAIPAAGSAAERATQINNAINAISDTTKVRAELAGGGVTLSSITGDITVNALSTPDTGLTTGTYAATSSQRSLFDTVYQLATALRNDAPLERYIADVQLAMGHILDVQSTVGSRQNVVDEQNEVNSGTQLIMETRRSEEEDLDFTEAISRLNQQMVSLQAAQKAYIKVQGVSLFDYL